MVTTVDRDRVQRLRQDGAVVIEVLPAEEYGLEHLEGAVNIPLEKLNRAAVQHIRPDQPIVVYCNDSLWDMSARAACRLESLGFTQVYQYTAGKNDWTAGGLPRAGKLVGFPTAGDAVRRDVPTCSLAERVGDVRARVEAAGWDACVVVAEDRTVLGDLRGKALHGDPGAPAEAVMDPAPTTFRPSELLAGLALQLRQAGARRVLVTTPEGRLIGMLERDEAERRTGKQG